MDSFPGILETLLSEPLVASAAKECEPVSSGGAALGVHGVFATIEIVPHIRHRHERKAGADGPHMGDRKAWWAIEDLNL